MKNPIGVFVIAVLPLFSSHCTDSQEVRPIDQLGARLVAYDENGIERTIFKANTNITFGLSLVNKSDHDIEAGSYYDYCNVYQKEDFLLIYKLMTQDNGEEKWIAYGKPYQEPVACPTFSVAITVPASSEAKLHGGAWNSNPDNQPLTAGKYYTAFSFTLELDGQSRTHDLKLEFEVE